MKVQIEVLNMLLFLMKHNVPGQEKRCFLLGNLGKKIGKIKKNGLFQNQVFFFGI